jgi:hypothetical protein
MEATMAADGQAGFCLIAKCDLREYRDLRVLLAKLSFESSCWRTAMTKFFRRLAPWQWLALAKYAVCVAAASFVCIYYSGHLPWYVYALAIGVVCRELQKIFHPDVKPGTDAAKYRWRPPPEAYRREDFYAGAVVGRVFVTAFLVSFAFAIPAIAVSAFNGPVVAYVIAALGSIAMSALILRQAIGEYKADRQRLQEDESAANATGREGDPAVSRADEQK